MNNNKEVIRQFKDKCLQCSSGTTQPSCSGCAVPYAVEALERRAIDRCAGCEYECRPGDEEPCASCSNNYVNKWTQANWQE